MILQRDHRLRESINKWGCYLMSILFLVNKYRNHTFSTEIINDLYDHLVLNKYIDANCYIRDPAAIFKYLFMPVRYTQRHESVNRMCMENEIEILKFTWDRTAKGAWNHFVVGTGRGQVAFDPWGISKAVKYGILVNKRIFKILEA